MALTNTKLTTTLPDAIERREILAGNRPAIDLNELGRAYLEQGWLSDAIDFFERTKNVEKLQEIKARVIADDTFLLARLAKAGLVEVTVEEWRQAAEAALAAGRDRSAILAFERAGDPARAAEVKLRVESFRAELQLPTKSRGGGDIVN